MTPLIDKLHAAQSRLISDLDAVRAQIADLQPESVAPVHARDFAVESSDPLRWLVAGLIAEGSVGILTAHGGIGRSSGTGNSPAAVNRDTPHIPRVELRVPQNGRRRRSCLTG